MFYCSVMLRERCAFVACCVLRAAAAVARAVVHSRRTLRKHASGEHAMTLFCGHLSQRVCVRMIVL